MNEFLEIVKLILEKLPIDLNESIFTTLLYMILRIFQYSQSKQAIDILSILLSLNPMKQKEVSFWGISLQLAIEDLTSRIQESKIIHQGEIEMLFICLSALFRGCDLKQTSHIHKNVVNSIIQQLNINNTDYLHISMILQGIQDSIIRLARTGDSTIAIHYLGQLCGPIISWMINMTKKDVINEKNQTYIVSSILSGINILLASYSLIEQNNRSDFLSLFIPNLVILFRYSTLKKLNSLNLLCIQCFQRLGTTSIKEFKEQIQKMPHHVVNEVQSILSNIK